MIVCLLRIVNYSILGFLKNKIKNNPFSTIITWSATSSSSWLAFNVSKRNRAWESATWFCCSSFANSANYNHNNVTITCFTIRFYFNFFKKKKTKEQLIFLPVVCELIQWQQSHRKWIEAMQCVQRAHEQQSLHILHILHEQLQIDS